MTHMVLIHILEVFVYGMFAVQTLDIECMMY